MRALRKIGGGGGGPKAGVVVADGRGLRDDAGPTRPLVITFMWSLQGALNEPDRYRANLEFVAPWVDAKRPLYEVGWAPPLSINPGAPSENLPTFPDHLGAIARDLDLTWSLGMRSGITLSGKGTGYDLERLARDVGDVIAAGRADRVLIVEMQNEYNNGGDPVEVLERMARAIRPKIPNLIALSYFSPPPGATPEEIDRLHKEWIDRTRAVGGGVLIRHTERSGADHGWRDFRQAWDFKNDGPLVAADWEGPGPGSSGAVQTNPLVLAMKRALAIMCGAPIFTLHTGTGVYGDGLPSSSGAPRPPNFWEIDNINAILSALRNVEELLPAGVENWQAANTQWEPPNPVAPFQPHHHWEGDEEIHRKTKQRNNGVNKAYAALAPDGRWIQLPAGVREVVRLTASYPLRDVTVYDPISRRPLPGLEGRSFQTGEVLELPGGPWLDPNVAYIVHGHR